MSSTTRKGLRCRQIIPWVTALVGASCSSDPQDLELVVRECVEVSGFGSNTGDTRTMHGHSTFDFDGVEREAGVGVYLNDVAPQLDGTVNMSIVYQFSFPNGDLMLTNDPIVLAPTLMEDTYGFSVAMTITSAKGMFVPYAGQKPLSLNGEITFGPPETPGGLETTTEAFTLGGQLCGS